MDYKKIHDDISDAYYKGLPYEGEILTKEKFDALHELCTLNKMKDSNDRGLSRKEIDLRLVDIDKKQDVVWLKDKVSK